MSAKHDHAVRAKAFLAMAIEGLYRAQSEVISVYGHLSDDSKDIAEVQRKAEGLTRRLMILIESTP